MMLSLSTVSAQNDITVHDDSIGHDEEIELPEAMGLDIDTLLRQWNAEQYLLTDTDCRNQDVNPVFPDSIFIDRLSRMPCVMEMPYNTVVRKLIDQYTGRLRHSVSYMLGAANFYMPIFEEALSLYNLPLELKYLPIIESALDPMATSRKGAVGLWQFMLKTGKRYNLTVNSLVDERRDPMKATLAAAEYLSDLYKLYGDWNLVIAAYNCGPTQINKAIHRAGGERDYWKIYPYLPKETRGYVPAFIAANYVMNYYCEHNICPMRARLPEASDTITVVRDLSLQQVATLCNVPEARLHALNPQYKTDLVPGSSGECVLRLPSEAALKFIDLGDSIYSIAAGDATAKRKTVEVDEQSQEPTITSRRSYSSRRSSSRRSRPRRSRSRSSKSVTIQSGQTLSEIAEKHHTTVAKLKKLNKISGSSIRAGKKLRVK